MALESVILKWLSDNLPSLIAGAASALVYLRINRYATRLEKTEKRVRRLMEVCGETHPDKAKTLFDDGNDA